MRFFNSSPKQRLLVSPVNGILNINVGSDVELYACSEITNDLLISINDPNADSGDYFYLHLYIPIAKNITIGGPQGGDFGPTQMTGAIVARFVYNKQYGKYIMLSDLIIPEYEWWLGGGAVQKSTAYTVYDPLEASNLIDSYTNLANPGTRNATVVNAPTHTQGLGWAFNGVNQYVNSNTFQGDSWTTIIWSENAYTSSSIAYLMGSISVSPLRVYGISKVSQPSIKIEKGPTGVTVAAPSVNSIIAISGVSGYRNAALITSAIPAWAGGDAAFPSFIGAGNNAGPASSFHTGVVRRIAMYNFELSKLQIEAVCNSMLSINSLYGEDDLYKSVILALAPSCYMTLNNPLGSVVRDISGKLAWSEGSYIPLSNFGSNEGSPHGKALKFVGDTAMLVGTTNWGSQTGINMNEFSVSCWVKVISNVPVNARIFGITNAGGYLNIEVRDGTRLAFYALENGIPANSESLNVRLVSGQWHCICITNSLSSQKIITYVDGVPYEFSRPGTLTGFANGSVLNGSPYIGNLLTGAINHVSFFNRVLTQAEVISML